MRKLRLVIVGALAIAGLVVAVATAQAKAAVTYCNGDACLRRLWQARRARWCHLRRNQCKDLCP